ncbi:MAG TPA: hypothetical protein VI864_06985 [Candidatus Bathyarchaeia archaeon]|nr:hypothetical protein [Candidatus Bathyarchaeia archaeon]
MTDKESKKNEEGEAEIPGDVLSALLDFYSDRASGFASLFVASIFGLVTLSAIIQNYAGGNFWWYIIGGFPYIFFVVSGYFTWIRFSYWATMADNIEGDGLFTPYKSQIEKIKSCFKKKGKDQETNLYDYLRNEGEKQNKHPIKRLLSWGPSFPILYFVLILCLTIIVYWDFFNMFLPMP